MNAQIFRKWSPEEWQSWRNNFNEGLAVAFVVFIVGGLISVALRLAFGDEHDLFCGIAGASIAAGISMRPRR